MASTSFPSKHTNLEIAFWDLAILLICGVRRLLRTIPSNLPFHSSSSVSILIWMLWILTGLSSGWLLGFITR